MTDDEAREGDETNPERQGPASPSPSGAPPEPGEADQGPSGPPPEAVPGDEGEVPNPKD
jgi:hypothetical protein